MASTSSSPCARRRAGARTDRRHVDFVRKNIDRSIAHDY
jgi:hypothetical protein